VPLRRRQTFVPFLICAAMITASQESLARTGKDDEIIGVNFGWMLAKPSGISSVK
jgi:hypothetical protein